MLTAYLFIITIFAYILKGITGFGNTLVMASLFSFAVPNRLTTPIDLLFSIPTNAYMAWRERKNINKKIVLPLALMLLAGAIPGTLLLKSGNDSSLRAVLGLVVLAVGVEMLMRKPSSNINNKSNPVILISIGIISGALAGLYGIGAPLVAYISRTTTNQSEFRANLCCVFLVDNLFRLIYYLTVGLISLEVLKYTLILAPAAVVGMYAGVKLDLKLGKDIVRRATVVLLMLSGSVLFINNTIKL